jgi:hypothetical protein
MEKEKMTTKLKKNKRRKQIKGKSLKLKHC